jgi:hypothetical protein
MVYRPDLCIIFGDFMTEYGIRKERPLHPSEQCFWPTPRCLESSHIYFPSLQPEPFVLIVGVQATPVTTPRLPPKSISRYGFALDHTINLIAALPAWS